MFLTILMFNKSNKLFQKEGNVLFNDALNTFYLRLCGAGHAVKDHSYNEPQNPLPRLHGLFFPKIYRGLFYVQIHTDWIAHTTAFVTALAGTKNSSMSPPWRVDLMTHRTMSERSYHGATSDSLKHSKQQTKTSNFCSEGPPTVDDFNRSVRN